MVNRSEPRSQQVVLELDHQHRYEYEPISLPYTANSIGQRLLRAALASLERVVTQKAGAPLKAFGALKSLKRVEDLTRDSGALEKEARLDLVQVGAVVLESLERVEDLTGEMTLLSGVLPLPGPPLQVHGSRESQERADRAGDSWTA
eukprot:scaffold11018_cov127-Skeletonema_marinoi.AAC.6